LHVVLVLDYRFEYLSTPHPNQHSPRLDLITAIKVQRLDAIRTGILEVLYHFCLPDIELLDQLRGDVPDFD
jgi:hypothetical protein